MYSQNIINRFTNPQNAGLIRNADGSGSAGNSDAGDVIRLYIKVENEKITEAKFKAFGCVVAIAAADVVTDLILNKTIDTIKNITSIDIARELGEVDSNKQSCLSTAVEALHQTIEDYYEKQEKLKEKENGTKNTKKAKTKATK